MVKHLLAMRETRVRSLGWKDPLEKEMATHSSTLAWKIPWTEEAGRLHSMGSQRVGHDWANSLSLSFTLISIDRGQINIYVFKSYFMLNLLRIKTIQVQDMPFCNSSAWRCQKPCQKAPWDEGIQVSRLWVSKLKPSLPWWTRKHVRDIHCFRIQNWYE